jgi:arylsulfatase
MDRNVALVILDSFRFDSFRSSFDWISGKQFTNAYATSHWTIPTHASLFTGKYPSELGVHAKSPTLNCPEPSIAEQLSEDGYSTRFYSANTTLTHWDGWGRGFDELVEFARLDPREENLIDWAEFARQNSDSGLEKLPRAVGHALRANCPTVPALRQGYRYWRRSRADGGTKSVLRRVRSTEFENEGEFLVVNLMETHTPYHSPDGGGLARPRRSRQEVRPPGR